jgi:hypothetical protein
VKLRVGWVRSRPYNRFGCRAVARRAAADPSKTNAASANSTLRVRDFMGTLHPSYDYRICDLRCNRCRPRTSSRWPRGLRCHERELLIYWPWRRGFGGSGHSLGGKISNALMDAFSPSWGAFFPALAGQAARRGDPVGDNLIWAVVFVNVRPVEPRSTGSPYLENGFSSVSSMRSPGLCVKSRCTVVRSRSCWWLFSAKRPPVVGIEAARAWDRQLSGFYEQSDGFADQRSDLGPVQDAVERAPP